MLVEVGLALQCDWVFFCQTQKNPVVVVFWMPLLRICCIKKIAPMLLLIAMVRGQGLNEHTPV